jgi:hypothetical protein
MMRFMSATGRPELFKTMAGVDMLHVPYRGGARACRPSRRRGAGHVRHAGYVNGAHQNGHTAGATHSERIAQQSMTLSSSTETIRSAHLVVVLLEVAR